MKARRGICAGQRGGCLSSQGSLVQPHPRQCRRAVARPDSTKLNKTEHFFGLLVILYGGSLYLSIIGMGTTCVSGPKGLRPHEGPSPFRSPDGKGRRFSGEDELSMSFSPRGGRRKGEMPRIFLSLCWKRRYSTSIIADSILVSTGINNSRRGRAISACQSRSCAARRTVRRAKMNIGHNSRNFL
jgi:hypothetical protein